MDACLKQNASKSGLLCTDDVMLDAVSDANDATPLKTVVEPSHPIDRGRMARTSTVSKPEDGLRPFSGYRIFGQVFVLQ